MLVQCSQCGARGNVRSHQPGKQFKCPKCGGVMRAAPVTPAGAPPARRAAPPGPGRPAPSPPGARRPGPRSGLGRRKRRRIPVLPIVLAVFLLLAASIGGYQLYHWSRQPGKGARALGLLPGSTVAAVSLENIPLLLQELSELKGADRKKVRAAVDTCRERARDWLGEALHIERDAASRLRGDVVAAGAGLVPAKNGGPIPVLLLVLDTPGFAEGLLRRQLRAAEEVAGVPLYEAEWFAALFEETLALSPRPEPLRRMAEIAGADGAGSLEAATAFRQAREDYARKGAAWFFLSAGAVGQVSTLAGREAQAGSKFLPAADHVTGFLKIREGGLVAHVHAAMGDDPFYAQVRLAPRELDAFGYIPAAAQFAVALSLDDPPTAYDRILKAIDPRAEKAFGTRPSTVIRGFELGGQRSDRLFFQTDVVPALAGELGFFVIDGSRAALMLSVRDEDTARDVARRLVKKAFGVEPERSGANWTVPKGPPVTYTFIGDMLVASLGPEGVDAVRSARRAKKTLAQEEAFGQVRKDLPAESTLLFVARERAASARRRHAASPAWAALSLSMNESDVAATAAVPNVAQALLAAVSVGPGSGPGPAEEPVQQEAIRELSRKNILELGRLCLAFVREHGAGQHFPRSFAELIRTSIRSEKRRLLVRPGDTRREFQPGTPRTSYQTAFDAVRGHRFTADTPKTLPMLWEVHAEHEGKRWVVHFDGSATLEPTRVPDLIQRIRDGLAARPGPGERGPGP